MANFSSKDSERKRLMTPKTAVGKSMKIYGTVTDDVLFIVPTKMDL